ncbi:hypothetical protein E4J93_05840 [Collinsella sp. BA40]|uniref:hypothetical protein n=1 Tax=Collinsella sp. BA40 TaxID=2560852 RepID=UPI0011C8A5AF|nr:hypothetical protein [Collinsella sp. BA40]TXF35895.1 hypothetical protein E4J93_05840 [Collinsella sp. BA40]
MGMKNDSQNKSELKKCIVPGCEKTLPSDAVLPVCAYHLDEAKDKGLKIGSGVLTIASGVVMFFKKDGMKHVGEALGKAKRHLR